MSYHNLQNLVASWVSTAVQETRQRIILTWMLLLLLVTLLLASVTYMSYSSNIEFGPSWGELEAGVEVANTQKPPPPWIS